jgi:hypothetical protein
MARWDTDDIAPELDVGAQQAPTQLLTDAASIRMRVGFGSRRRVNHHHSIRRDSTIRARALQVERFLNPLLDALGRRRCLRLSR